MTLVVKLKNELNDRLDKLITQMSGAKKEDAGDNSGPPPIPMLLKAALKNEWETSLLTCEWVSDEEDPDFRISLARLAGDEARHFELIKKRLDSMGESLNPDELNLRSPMYKFLKDQTNTFDRIVTGPFTREALAVARNKLFLEYCEKKGDSGTLEIYKTIQEDEGHHHKLGEVYLEKVLKSEDDYKRAHAQMMGLLDVVEDIQEMVVIKKGLSHIPGC